MILTVRSLGVMPEERLERMMLRRFVRDMREGNNNENEILMKGQGVEIESLREASSTSWPCSGLKEFR